MKNLISYTLLLLFSTLLACNSDTRHRAHRHLTRHNNDSLHLFTDDVKLLSQQTTVTILKDSTGKAAIAITPAWRGQVIGSTFDSEKGLNMGWIDRNGETGGEDWLAGDSTAFTIVQQQKQSVLLEKKVGELLLQRRITLISRRDIANYLNGTSLHKSVEGVAFESENIVTNNSEQPVDSVVISNGGYFRSEQDIRLLLPDKPRQRFNIVVPGKAGHITVPEACNYFGYYDGQQDVLTIIQFTMPEGKAIYTDNLVIRTAYSSFLMLSASSPLTKLKPGSSLQHYHRTIHLSGAPKRLEPVLKKVFGITMKELEATF